MKRLAIALLVALSALAILPARAARGDATYQGLWWASPPGSESGWGLNITHQGDILFATWFTYDTDGSPMWLVMSNATMSVDYESVLMEMDMMDMIGPVNMGIMAPIPYYGGELHRATGPGLRSASFNPSSVRTASVGNARLAFKDSDNGTFTYTVNGITQSKSITRQVYAASAPTCIAGATMGSKPNYQDLWWNASESGWGVNITHQGDILFATWFTYGDDGKGQWLVMSNGKRTGATTYSGTFYRTRGPAFHAMPWMGKVEVAAVGTGTFTFSDPSSATFSYSVDGLSKSKAITRQVFASPASVCLEP